MRIVFLGTPGFAAVSLQAILDSSHEVVGVVAQPDRRAGRGMKVHRPEVALLAESRGLPLVQPAKIRTDEFLNTISSMRPEIGVVVAYGRILPGALLDIPPRGFLNVHASILPAYRGAAPIQRAIEAGETETGVSIMQLDELLDHGPVFEIERTAIAPDEHSPSLFERLASIGGSALVRVLDAIENGSAISTEQDHERATIAAKIEKSEGLVDWSLSAKRIYDRFRAFDPWPGVSVVVDGEMVRLVDIRPADSGPGAPGSVQAFDGDSLVVATSEGALALGKVQRPGKSPVSGADFARGKRLAPGSRLS